MKNPQDKIAELMLEGSNDNDELLIGILFDETKQKAFFESFSQEKPFEEAPGPGSIRSKGSQIGQVLLNNMTSTIRNTFDKVKRSDDQIDNILENPKVNKALKNLITEILKVDKIEGA